MLYNELFRANPNKTEEENMNNLIEKVVNDEISTK